MDSKKDVKKVEIDIVITWVDDSDPAWRNNRNRYAGKPDDCSAVRFRDWDLLRYWFRAVEQNMPWVRKIHFVTCGHYPEWLNTNNPKLNLVKHSDYIPEEYLPTFSARPIELNFHRIDGLSEFFVYFNDDMFPMSPIKPEDVFRQGLPRASAVVSPLIPLSSPWPFGHTLLNDISVVNGHFKLKETVKKKPWNWFAPCYGKHILKNIYNMYHRNYFLGFEAFHEPSSLLKSSFDAVWKMEPKLLHDTCIHKFRSPEDVNQYVIQYYQFCSNRFVPRSPKCVKYFDVDNNNGPLLREIAWKKVKFLIVNDSSAVTDFDLVKQQICHAFDQAFPIQSSFERDHTSVY